MYLQLKMMAADAPITPKNEEYAGLFEPSDIVMNFLRYFEHERGSQLL